MKENSKSKVTKRDEVADEVIEDDRLDTRLLTISDQECELDEHCLDQCGLDDGDNGDELGDAMRLSLLDWVVF